MQITSTLTRHQNFELSFSYDDRDILRGITLKLFSESPNITERTKAIIGNHFICKIEQLDTQSIRVTICPKEYCLVNGGMMYKTAGTIIANLISNGIFVRSMDTIIQ